MSNVLLFSTSTCSWCRRAKRYFKDRGVPFKEINIERDPDAARDIVHKTGQTGVPVIKIGSKWNRRVRQRADREGAGPQSLLAHRSAYSLLLSRLAPVYSPV